MVHVVEGGAVEAGDVAVQEAVDFGEERLDDAGLGDALGDGVAGLAEGGGEDVDEGVEGLDVVFGDAVVGEVGEVGVGGVVDEGGAVEGVLSLGRA